MQACRSPNDINLYLESLCKDYGVDREIIFKDITKRDRQIFSATTLMQISKNLNVDARSLINRSLNIEALKNFLDPQERKIMLPRSYQENAYSSTTSLRSIICEFKRFGKYEETLRLLQIDEKVLDIHQPLSILVVQRAIDNAKNLITNDDLFNMSKRNAHAFLNKNSFGPAFREKLRFNNPAEALFETVHHIERNWNYKIVKSQSNSILVETSQSEEMLDSCSTNYTTNYMNTLRFGFFKNVFQSLNKNCMVKQLTPVHSRGLFKFELIYDNIKRPLFQNHHFQ